MEDVGRWRVWGRVCGPGSVQLWVQPPEKQGRGREVVAQAGTRARTRGPASPTGTKWGSSQQDEMGRVVTATCSERIVFGAQFEYTGY